jgi:hypothetical protein
MYFFCFVFNENMLRKLLGFDRMLENKIYIFLFLEMNFFYYYYFILEETGYF